MNHCTLVGARCRSVNDLKPVAAAFATVIYGVVDSMPRTGPQRPNDVKVIVYPLAVAPIAEIDVCAAIQKLVLIECLNVIFALDLHPPAGVGNTIDIPIIDETKNSRAQGQEHKSARRPQTR